MALIARKHPLDGVYSRWRKFLKSPSQLIPGEGRLTMDMPGWEWIQKAFLIDDPTYPGRFLLPRKIIEDVGGWDERLAFSDDMEFYSRVICRLPMMRYCSQSLFLYRQGVPGSISNTSNRKSSESHLLAISSAADHLLAVKNNRATRHAAARQLMFVAHANLIAAPDISGEAERYAGKIFGLKRHMFWVKGGKLRRMLQLFFGWKLALRLHNLLRSLLERVR